MHGPERECPLEVCTCCGCFTRLTLSPRGSAALPVLPPSLHSCGHLIPTVWPEGSRIHDQFCSSQGDLKSSTAGNGWDGSWSLACFEFQPLQELNSLLLISGPRVPHPLNRVWNLPGHCVGFYQAKVASAGAQWTFVPVACAATTVPGSRSVPSKLVR